MKINPTHQILFLYFPEKCIYTPCIYITIEFNFKHLFLFIILLLYMYICRTEFKKLTWLPNFPWKILLCIACALV